MVSVADEDLVRGLEELAAPRFPRHSLRSMSLERFCFSHVDLDLPPVQGSAHVIVDFENLPGAYLQVVFHASRWNGNYAGELRVPLRGARGGVHGAGGRRRGAGR
ncbi:hypothetical protein GCM10010038_00610 [Glutamicibacter protophormiae]|nr:hypothetical protein GCM10010038_00610 [Glutamicibacter protophormiae]